LGIGDWGLGIGDWAQSPIPNPQSPIPNPHKIFYILIPLNIKNKSFKIRLGIIIIRIYNKNGKYKKKANIFICY